MKKIIFFVSVFLMVSAGGAGLSIAYEKEGEEEKLEVLHRQISFFENRLQAKPDDANFHFQLGTKYYELGRFFDERAKRVVFTEKNELDRNRANRLYLDSIDHLQTSLEMQPNNAGAHFNLSVSYLVQGDGENAIAHMRKSEQIFMDLKDKRGVAKARKALREWFDRYGYRPEDFPIQN